MIQIRRNAMWMGLVLAVTAAALGGCNVLDSVTGAYAPLQIQSVEKKDKVIQPAFSDVVYYPDRDRVLHVISSAEGTDPATGKAVKQILIMRIFWIPIGGKTSMNPTSLNFTFRYLVIAEDSAAQYEGAGFARLYDEPDAGQLPIRIVDADLRMTEKTEKFVDVLQRCRVAGNVTARRDDHEAVARLLAAEREYFHATLEISHATTQPATSGTAPATRPMPEIKFFDGTTTMPATVPATESDRVNGISN
jgi:hypothetical protein